MLRVSQPRIISFVQLLGKPGIFRPLLEYCTLNRIGLRRRGRGTGKQPLIVARRIADQISLSKLAQQFPDKIPSAISSLTLRGKLFSFPTQFYGKYFCLW
jgi:hypothetical protein